MYNKDKYKDSLSQSLYEISEALYNVGAMEEITFKEITDECLVQKSVKPARVKREVSAMQLETVM